jgi:hypothetical protein
VEQLDRRDVPSVSVSVVVPGGHHGHHGHHHSTGVNVHVNVGSSVGVIVSVGFGGVNISI